MCSYKNRVLAVTKILCCYKIDSYKSYIQALRPKYAVTNSSCYKLLLFAVTNRKLDSYKIANSYNEAPKVLMPRCIIVDAEL